MAVALTEEELCSALSNVLLTSSSDVDEDLVGYLAGLIDSSEHTLEELAETGDEGPAHELLGPFLESSGCDENVISRAVGAVNELASSKLSGGFGVGDASAAEAAGATSNADGSNAPTRKLRQGLVSMSSALEQESEHEADANRYLWGADSGVAAFTNEQKDAHTSKQSAKERRKAKQELEKARKEYEAKVRAMEEAEAKDAANGAATVVVAMRGIFIAGMFRWRWTRAGPSWTTVRSSLLMDGGTVWLAKMEWAKPHCSRPLLPFPSKDFRGTIVFCM
jgi:hypothetical protein